MQKKKPRTRGSDRGLHESLAKHNGRDGGRMAFGRGLHVRSEHGENEEKQ